MQKTFLELTQMTARESGTVSGNLPRSVDGQTGRLLKFVNWTRTAWVEIQNSQASWNFLKGEYQGTLTQGAAQYTHNTFHLDRFSAWETYPRNITTYDMAIGPSAEGALGFVYWDLFDQMYRRGPQQEGRPIHYSVAPDGSLWIGPTPNGSYFIRGAYRKSPQELTENGDIPDMPGQYHDVIAWYALVLMAEHDEAELHIATAARRYRDMMFQLRRDQNPRLEYGGGPLA